MGSVNIAYCHVQFKLNRLRNINYILTKVSKMHQIKMYSILISFFKYMYTYNIETKLEKKTATDME